MAIDLSNPIELTVSQTVLTLETNDGRFENFCRDVVSFIEGDAVIFSTSKSWDLGRDGVGAGKARGIYICVSLRDDVDQKTLLDLNRITSTTKKIERLYFCSSQRLTEHKITLIEGQLSDEIDHAFPITCLGATQLTEASGKKPEIVERYYAPEIRGALRAISSEPSDEVEIQGLRLALVAASGDNSIEIRKKLYCGGLIECLSGSPGKTISGCAKALSERLHIGYIISDAAIRPHLQDLIDDGLIIKTGPSCSLTEKGEAYAASLKIEAAERFLGGRLAIRKALEESIGARLADENFNQIWKIFEERIASHFHARGAALVSEISTLLDLPTSDEAPKTKSQISFLDELATAVAQTSSHAQRRAELHQAVTDIFADRTSGATDWLVRVCASFVACCALGLEHSSSAALGKLFGRTTLVLDSDVVLSLLGEGEPEHESVFTIVSKWAKVGGKILVAESVLEEVAYHAHIAQHDFNQVLHILPGTPEDRLRIIENAFVRSFAENMSQNRATVNHWGKFISQFRGRSPYDWKPIVGHLRAEYSINTLPGRPSEFEELEARVKKYLIKTAESRGHFGKAARDKASRDARLYAQMVGYLQTIRSTDPGATCLLVSSAHRLAEAEDVFQESGEQQIVVPISTVLHLLSLLPQVSLGLSAMKTFLFEERRAGFSSDLERTILRLIRSSQAVSMPWAKRGVLMREVRDRLIEDARKQGRTIPNDASTYMLEKMALSPAQKERTIQVLADALDKVVVKTKIEDENTKLRQENEALRKQLELAKTRSARRR